MLAFDAKNLAPRLGFAWSPFVSAAHGDSRRRRFLLLPNWALIEMQFDMVAPPVQQSVHDHPAADQSGATVPTRAERLPALSPASAERDLRGRLPNGSTAFLLNPDGRTPYIAQWNYSIQHTFGNNDLLEADYLGSSAHRVQDRYEANQCRPGPDLFCNASTIPYPRYASLLTSDFNGNTSYEALVTRYEHRAAAVSTCASSTPSARP